MDGHVGMALRSCEKHAIALLEGGRDVATYCTPAGHSGTEGQGVRRGRELMKADSNRGLACMKSRTNRQPMSFSRWDKALFLGATFQC